MQALNDADWQKQLALQPMNMFKFEISTAAGFPQPSDRPLLTV
jgi:hypothetical protein